MAQKKIRKGKKRWYQLYAPKIFDNQLIGETYVYETEQIPEKHMTINLMNLTNNPKKQNMSVLLKVAGLKENKASTKVLGIQMSPQSAKRLVRRGRSKVSDSFLAKTKSGQLVRVKPIIVTRTRTTHDTQKALRVKCQEVVRELTRKYTFDTIMNDIVHMRFQKHLREQLMTTFPVRSVDIRYFKYAQEVSMDEDELEKSTYSATEDKPKKAAPKKASSEAMQSLKDELLAEKAPEKEEAPAEAKEEKAPAKAAKEEKPSEE